MKKKDLSVEELSIKVSRLSRYLSALANFNEENHQVITSSLANLFIFYSMEAGMDVEDFELVLNELLGSFKERFEKFKKTRATLEQLAQN